MSPNALPTTRPKPGVLFGITHSPDGELIIREPKLLKVGIGLAKGPAITVWTQMVNHTVKWRVTRGYNEEGNTKRQTFDCNNRAEAEEVFARELSRAPICPYPRKIGYFTFSKPVMIDGQELYAPDFEAIEAHGPTPTEIDIVILDDDPFVGSFQMWAASGLQCQGDGIDAMRIVTLATTDEHKALAKIAIEAEARRYPIVQGCWTLGCPYAKPGQDNRGRETPSPCKPGGDLKFQLAFSLRVGGVAFFHTTGIRSIQNIFSSLHRIRTLTGGRMTGLPLKMTLRPYKTNHNGQPATHYGVGLEFRAENVAQMRQKLAENVFAFQNLAAGKTPAPVKLIDSPEPDDTAADEEDGELGTGFSPAALTKEFGGLGEGFEEPAAPEAAAEPGRADALSSKLQAARKKPETGSPPAATSTPGPVPVPPADKPEKKDLF